MARPRLQKRRLLKLAAYLETLPEQYAKPPSKRRRLPGFWMAQWFRDDPTKVAARTRQVVSGEWKL